MSGARKKQHKDGAAHKARHQKQHQTRRSRRKQNQENEQTCASRLQASIAFVKADLFYFPLESMDFQRCCNTVTNGNAAVTAVHRSVICSVSAVRLVYDQM